jgi:hypothetical protein
VLSERYVCLARYALLPSGLTGRWRRGGSVGGGVQTGTGTGISESSRLDSFRFGLFSTGFDGLN